MNSDFPLDYETVRDVDSGDEGEQDGYFCYFDDSDESDGISTGKKRDPRVIVPFMMPALNLEPMLLSKDETQDAEFLASICMEDALEFIIYRFEGRGAVDSATLCLHHWNLTGHR